MSETECRPIGFDELPRLSPWPARLVGTIAFEQRRRTTAEVTREYDRDKWGTVLTNLEQSQRPSDDDLLRWQGLDPDAVVPFAVADRFFTATTRYVMERSDRLLIETLSPWRSSRIVELGSGLGDKLIKVAAALQSTENYGGEFTAAGVACGRLLSKARGVRAEFARFDYNDPSSLATVPREAVVYTSHSIEQIPQLRAEFLEALLERAPRQVIHLEPCYEDHSDASILGLMRRRYIELNDYNRNLVSLLRSFAVDGRLRIEEHHTEVFGAMPFNPTSVIRWVPA